MSLTVQAYVGHASEMAPCRTAPKGSIAKEHAVLLTDTLCSDPPLHLVKVGQWQGQTKPPHHPVLPCSQQDLLHEQISQCFRDHVLELPFCHIIQIPPISNAFTSHTSSFGSCLVPDLTQLLYAAVLGPRAPHSLRACEQQPWLQTLCWHLAGCGFDLWLGEPPGEASFHCVQGGLCTGRALGNCRCQVTHSHAAHWRTPHSAWFLASGTSQSIQCKCSHQAEPSDKQVLKSGNVSRLTQCVRTTR